MIRHWPKLGRKAAHLWRWGSKGKVGQVMQMMRHFYLALSVGGKGCDGAVGMRKQRRSERPAVELSGHRYLKRWRCHRDGVGRSAWSLGLQPQVTHLPIALHGYCI